MSGGSGVSAAGGAICLAVEIPDIINDLAVIGQTTGFRETNFALELADGLNGIGNFIRQISAAAGGVSRIIHFT